MTNRFSRRQFLRLPIAALSAMMPMTKQEQPYPPYGPSPAPDNDPMNLTEEAWRMNIIGIVALHWYMIKNHGMEIKRLKWLVPGPDLYTNKRGNT